MYLVGFIIRISFTKFEFTIRRAIDGNMLEALPLSCLITSRQTENIGTVAAYLIILVHMLLFHSPGTLTILIAVELHS